MGVNTSSAGVTNEGPKIGWPGSKSQQILKGVEIGSG